MSSLVEGVIKLLFAVLVGGLIGAEREFRDKVAGFRTLIFITLGATLFTMFSIRLSGNGNDPTRIAANIVTGIGFLGAGAILREGHKVAGLTTAATIWVAASLGMGIGGGEYILVGVSTAIILLVLWIFPFFEHWLDNIHESRTYEIVLPLTSRKRHEVIRWFQEAGLRVHSQRESKSGDRAITIWRTIGRPNSHRKLISVLMDEPEVIEFHY